MSFLLLQWKCLVKLFKTETMINANQPAYPNERGAARIGDDFKGLSKRELIAAMAMQGYISAGAYTIYSASDMSNMSVKDADSLLSELEKAKP